MSAEGQIKAFIDRILRLKEEQDVIGDDIRDIYAEAKGMGFDKTAMGNVVAHLRKVAKKGSETVAEQGAIFDIYLAAYAGHAPAPARVRENIEQFDPLTGEFLDDNVDPKLVQTIAMGVQTEIGRKVLIAAVDVMIEQEEAEEETHQRPSTNDEPSPEAGPRAEASPAGTGSGTLADREGRFEGEAASVDLPTNSEIAAASQGEAVIPSAEAETSGANEGGENVDCSATRAGLEGGPVNLEPSGPEAEWATDFADDGIRYEAFPPRPMKSLPYASCFPELSKVEYDALTTVIKLQGVQEPIVRMGDVIVNGWNRYNIARSLGIEYPVIRYTGKDVLLDVIEMQREDRAWISAQEQKIAARLAKEVPHRASEIMRAFQIEEEFA